MIAAALALSTYRWLRTPAPRPSVPWTLLAIGLLFPAVVLLNGTIFHATGPMWTPHSLASVFSVAMLGAHLVFVGRIVWRTRGARLLVAAVSALQIAWALGATLVAVMSNTGNWI